MKSQRYIVSRESLIYSNVKLKNFQTDQRKRETPILALFSQFFQNQFDWNIYNFLDVFVWSRELVKKYLDESLAVGFIVWDDGCNPHNSPS